MFDDRTCTELLQWALPRLGLRWGGFSNVRGQVCKRIARRIRELGLRDAAAYRRLLESDPAELRTLDSFCRITISRFHRDRAVFERLRWELLPPLVDRARTERRRLRAWTAGCASGEEPWTLALVLRLGLGLREDAFEIIATDADAHLLQRARRAIYRQGTLRELSPDWLSCAFEPAESRQRLRDAFRSGVEFRQEDLRDRAPEGPFDAVLCRNVAFTYFDVPLQELALSMLAERLIPQGLLVIGAHESLPMMECGGRRFERAAGALPIYRAP
jgi:chemotaxis protein methyltransferase CheR